MSLVSLCCVVVCCSRTVMWLVAAALSKTWVCGRWLAGIAGSNLAGGHECLLWMLCVVR